LSKTILGSREIADALIETTEESSFEVFYLFFRQVNGGVAAG
jgi:hypothetical protein